MVITSIDIMVIRLAMKPTILLIIMERTAVQQPSFAIFNHHETNNYWANIPIYLMLSPRVLVKMLPDSVEEFPKPI